MLQWSAVSPVASKVDAPAAEGQGDLASVREDVALLLSGKMPDAELGGFLERLDELAAREPSPELARLISELLDHPWLGQRPLDGQPVRRRLLRAQQALGFPWALEVKPEDLQLLSSDPASLLSVGARVSVAVAAAVSVLWSAPVLLLMVDGLEYGARPEHSLLPVISLFLLTLLNGLASLVAAFKRQARPWLRWLGRTWVAGALLTLLMAALESGGFPAVGLATGIAALPLMTTSWLALWHSKPRG